MALIYCAAFDNGKKYVGVTKNTLERRMRQHIGRAKHNSQSLFHRALRKHKYAVSWSILEITQDCSTAFEKEKLYIEQLNSISNGYNCTKGGRGIVIDTISDNQKRKISVSLGSKPFLVFKDDKLVGKWISKSECARDLGLSRSKISACLNGEKYRQKHHGFTFRYGRG